MRRKGPRARSASAALAAALLLLLCPAALRAESATAIHDAAGERARDFRAQRAFEACGRQAAALAGSARADKERQCRRDLALSRLMEARALWNAFADDPLTAGEIYEGRLLAVRGVITSVGTSPLGFPEVVLGLDGFGVRSVRLRFPSAARAVVEALRPGRTITVGGICKGMVRDDVVRMDSCELLPQARHSSNRPPRRH